MGRVPLPPDLPVAFTVAQARELGLSRGRLRSPDVSAPFHGVRVRPRRASDAPVDEDGPSSPARIRALAYGPRLRPGQFFSHETAALLWKAPIDVRADDPIHVGVTGNLPVARTRGVRGHRVQPGMVAVREQNGYPVASPASCWASLGRLPLRELVVLGDYFCRVWRRGFLRRDAGKAPLATPTQLATALAAGRREGAGRLREALALIRLDSWSPQETRTRLVLVGAGVPEPELNVDVWGEDGLHLGCVDLCFRRYRVVVEYQGVLHASTFAKDVERVERLRAAGWLVIQVASGLLRDEATLVDRVRTALRAGGWNG